MAASGNVSSHLGVYCSRHVAHEPRTLSRGTGLERKERSRDHTNGTPLGNVRLVACRDARGVIRLIYSGYQYSRSAMSAAF